MKHEGEQARGASTQWGAGRVTAAAIARHTGLSRSTVAGVLAGQAERMRIHPDTRRRVLSAADELGYRPDTAARAMRTGRYSSVGLLQPSADLYSPSTLLEGVMGALEQRHIQLTLARLPDAALASRGHLPKVVAELAVDGLLVNHIFEVPRPVEDAIRRYRVPVVWINNKLAADCVHPDDIGGAREATRRLLALGHRRIAFVLRACEDRVGGHYSVADRITGYREAMTEAGLEPRVVRLGAARIDGPEARIADAVALLSAPGRPTAVLAYERAASLPVALAAPLAGLAIPRDLSLVEFHYLKDWESGLRICGVGTRMEEVGARAVGLLMDKIERPEEPQAPAAVAMHLPWEEGATVAPAPTPPPSSG